MPIYYMQGLGGRVRRGVGRGVGRGTGQKVKKLYTIYVFSSIGMGRTEPVNQTLICMK